MFTETSCTGKQRLHVTVQFTRRGFEDAYSGA
jgi:hypothetical protein